MRKRLWILLTAAVLLWTLCGSAVPATAAENLLADIQFTTLEEGGFTVPLPGGEGWVSGRAYGTRGLFGSAQRTGAEGPDLYLQCYHQMLSRFVTEDEEARDCYDRYLNFTNDRNVKIREIEIDGHAARLITFSYNNFGEDTFGAHAGILLYARDMRMLQLRLYSEKPGEPSGRVPEVTMADMELLAGLIQYDNDRAPIRKSDTEITIGTAEGSFVTIPGKKLQMTVAFGNPDVVNATNGNNRVTWEVKDAMTGGATAYAKIGETGMLTVGQNAPASLQLQVRACSETYGSTAEAVVTVAQKASGITVQPQEMTFWAGQEEAVLASAALIPTNLQNIGLVWTASRDGIVEITDLENGTAMIRPAGAGKTTVLVREPGGLEAGIAVTVRQPVTGVSITWKGKVRPNASLMMRPVFEPSNVSDKSVSWSVEADEGVAEITPKGKLKISRFAPPGSVITVICTAKGAPEPVEGRIEMTVVEK